MGEQATSSRSVNPVARNPVVRNPAGNEVRDGGSGAAAGGAADDVPGGDVPGHDVPGHDVPGWQMVSSSRLAVFDRCQRQFFYRYRRWLPEENRPILHFGRAVEEAVLRAFATRPPAERAGSLEELLAWAAADARAHVAPALERARLSWESDPNRVDTWEDGLDPQRGEAMAAKVFTPAFFGTHVEECLDGLPAEERVSDKGALLAAWALARPRFTHPDEEGFEGQLRVPVERPWFSGAFDLWFTHAGKSRVVDLKSSSRGGIFSAQYRDQLAAYCWIHREVLGRMPDAIELWYLGEDEPEPVPLPSDSEIDEYVSRAHTLFELGSREERDSEDDFPAVPAPTEGRSWCTYCGFQSLCPRTREESAPRPGGRALADATRDGELVDVRVEIAAVRKLRTNDKGTRIQKLEVADASGHRELTFFNEDIDKHCADLRRGDVLLLKQARVNVWRDEAGLVCGWQTSLERAEETHA